MAIYVVDSAVCMMIACGCASGPDRGDVLDQREAELERRAERLSQAEENLSAEELALEAAKEELWESKKLLAAEIAEKKRQILTAMTAESMGPVACTIRFSPTLHDEVDRVRSIVKGSAMNQLMKEAVAGDGERMWTFETQHLADLCQIHAAIAELREELIAAGLEKCDTALAYRAAFGDARLTITIQGKVAKGSDLFVYLGGTKVSCEVDAAGRFSKEVTIPRGTEWVYGVSTLGSLKKHFKIDVWTAVMQNISREEFEAGVR